MNQPRFRRPCWHLGLALGLLAAVAGCGGGGGVSSAPAPIVTPTPTPTATASPSPTPTPTPTAAFLTSEYNRSTGPSQHGAITAWSQGYSGAGVTIGFVDTGIDSDSPEFAGRIAPASADVAGSRGIDPEDDHGTNVAMVAAAARDNTGIMGMAFNATIAMFRADSPGSCATFDPNVKDSGCKFTDSDIARGVDAAVAAGARVINLSLGGSSPSAVLRAAVSRATAAGAVIVVSAGNDGDSTDPAVDPNNPDPFAAGLQAVGNGNVIIAGSVDKDGNFSAFSNKAGTGANWFLSARGERVCCVYDNGVLKVVDNPDGTRSVFVFSGTSFAAPQIAGAAALLRQAFPNLTAVQVVDLLLRTARDAGAAGTDAVYGRGILDVAAAFAPQGLTSLAGGTIAITGTDTTAVTSAPMGDATTKARGITAIMLDSYRRAYRINLAAGLRGAQVQPRLQNALRADTRNLVLGGGALSLAFSVDARGQVARLPWQGQLRLSRADAEAARVLAARVVAQVAPGRRLGFAFAQGADGLVAQLQGRSQPAFLIAQSPVDDLGFGESGQTSLALRQQAGAWGITALAEHGAAVAAAPVALNGNAQGRLAGVPANRLGLAVDRRFGAFDAALGASWLGERQSLLGARLHPALGASGADSLFLDAAAGWQPGPRWRLGAAWRRGFTHAHSGGTLGAGSDLVTSAWALDAVRTGVLQTGDTLSLRLAQPLRVERGGINLTLPVDYSYTTLDPVLGLRTLSLAPQGRELDAELNWRGSLGGGAAMASLFWRRDPGHYRSLPNDRGAAVSWVRKF